MSRDYGMDYTTARERVWALLRDLGWHTNAELREAGGVRYGARLLELKRLGYRIDAEELAGHGRRYRLESLEPGLPQGKRVRVLLDEADAAALIDAAPTLTARAALTDALGSYRANKGKL